MSCDDRLVEFFVQDRSWRQFGEVRSNTDAAVVKLQKFDVLFGLVCTEDES